MGIKCLILLLPSALVTYRTQVCAADFLFGLLAEKKHFKKITSELCLSSVGSVDCVFTSPGAVADAN